MADRIQEVRFMWPFKKTSADHALNELVEGLSGALGERLASVLLFGSKASGEFREGHSMINVFFVVETVSGETLSLLAGPVRAWIKAGHPPPVFVGKNELQAYADSLPIEFLDMQDHHKVLHGTDVLQALAVDRRSLRAQCAQELSVKLLKLRQARLLAGGDQKRLRALLLDSLPGVLTLFRAVLRLEAEVPKGRKIEAARELSRRVGLDGDVLERLWDLHLRRQSDSLEDLAGPYLAAVEKVLLYVRKV
jgi:hypothetical protein